MKKTVGFSLALALVFLLANCVTKAHSEEGAGIKGEKEMLVARDVGSGGEIYATRWCGNSALLFQVKNIGIEMIDFTTGQKMQVSEDMWSIPLNCTPDGKWVLYEDIRKKEVYRYEVSTGKRQKIAVVEEGGWWDAVSPDGKRVFLGPMGDGTTDVPVPEWEHLWFSHGWDAYEAIWFPDSSGVLSFVYSPGDMCVEFFGVDGWAKCFDLEPEDKDNIGGFFIDEENRIYFTESEVPDPIAGKRYQLYRCSIKGRELSCERVFEDKRKFSTWYVLLPDGGMLFQDDEKDCIRRISSGKMVPGCAIGPRYGDEVYDVSLLFGMSQDGRWLVFKRGNRFEKPDGEFSHWEGDLFVIDLKTTKEEGL